MSEQINDLWRDFLRLNLSAPVGYAYNDLESDYVIALCTIFLGYPTNNLNDALAHIARFFHANGYPEVDPVMPHGRVAIAVANDGLCYDQLQARGNRNDIWRNFLLRGASTLQSYIDLSTGIVAKKADGTSVNGTYTRTDTNGVVYYNNGTGTLSAASSNVPYRHSTLGMFFEIASQNLFLQSLVPNDVYWTKTNASIDTINTTASPFPSAQAQKLIETAGTAVSPRISRLAVTKPTATAIPVSFSAYVKAGGCRFVTMRINSNTVPANRVDVKFDLEAGGSVVSSALGGAYTASNPRVNFMSNGWVRISATVTTSTEAAVDAHIFLNNDKGVNPYNPVGGGRGVWLWGMQLEAKDVRTSLMASVASSATRSAPALTFPVTAYDLIPAPGTNFSVFAQLYEIRTVDTQATFGRVYHTTGEVDRYLAKGGGSNFSARYGNTNAVGPVPQQQSVDIRQSVRIGSANKLAVGGAVVGTQATVNNPTGSATVLRIGSSLANTDIFHGFIKRITFGSEASIA